MQPALADLDLFATVARTRSFRAAARELRLSPSRLSERLRDLEARLGVRLLNRTTRSVSPTEAGAALLESLVPALDSIGNAVSRLGDLGETPSGLLRINAPGSIAETVLMPRVGAFMAAYPLIRLDLVVEDSFVDIVAAGFDAGCRYDEAVAQDVIAVPIGPPQRYAMVAAPALIEARGMPSHPRDLIGAPAIQHRFKSGSMIDWEFERDGETIMIRPEARAISSNPHIEVALAEGGAGFLATFAEWTQPGINAGRLVEVLPDWLPPFPGARLYYSSRRHMPATLRAFIDFMRWRE